MIGTLLSFAEERETALQKLKTAAQQALTKSSGDIATIQESLDKVVKESTDLEKKIIAKRKQAAEALMPADMEALAEEIRNLTIELWKKRAELVKAREDLDAAKQAVAASESRFKYLSELVAQVQKEITSEKKREADHNKWKEKISDGTMAALSSNADKLIDEITDSDGDDDDDSGEPEDDSGDTDDTGETGESGGETTGEDTEAESSDTGGGDAGEGDTAGASGGESSDDAGSGSDTGDDDPLKKEKELIAAAKARIESDIPEKLLAHARHRRAVIKTALNDLENLKKGIENELMTHRQGTEGAAGKSVKLRVEFDRSEAALKSCILHSEPRYQQALTLLETIKKSKVLSDAEKARITDAVMISAGEAAAEKEKKRDVARAAVVAKSVEIELAVATAYIKDITADPENDAQVQALQTALQGLQAALITAETNFTADMRKDLNQWRASVPDHIWSNMLGYDNSVELLTDIKDADPQALSIAMDNAQDALVTALVHEDKAARATHQAASLIQDLADRLKFVQEKQPQKIFSVLYTDY